MGSTQTWYRGARASDGTRRVARIQFAGDAMIITSLPEPHRLTQQDGFDWGTANEQAADLAYAILQDLYGPETASDYSDGLLCEIVAHLPTDKPFMLSSDRIDGWLKRQPADWRDHAKAAGR